MQGNNFSEDASAHDYSALARKINSRSPLQEQETRSLEDLQRNTFTVEKSCDFILVGQELGRSLIVVEGWVARYVSLTNGRRQILGYAIPGDILELHTQFPTKAGYSASALTPVVMANLDAEQMERASCRSPTIAEGLGWLADMEIAILRQHTVRLGQLSGEQRLAHLFLELWHRLNFIRVQKSDWIEQPTTQLQLADTLGMSVVHINRSLKVLREKKLITIAKDQVRLNNIPLLIEWSEFNPEHFHSR